MRITVLDFDTGDDAAAALAAISAALGRRNGSAAAVPLPQVQKSTARPHAIEAAVVVEHEEKLSPQLSQTWSWLTSHSTPEGVNAAAIAERLHIKPATATWRLNQLIGRGLAHRVRRGYYRAGER